LYEILEKGNKEKRAMNKKEASLLLKSKIMATMDKAK
jgi:hypothetical protein